VVGSAGVASPIGVPPVGVHVPTGSTDSMCADPKLGAAMAHWGDGTRGTGSFVQLSFE
jgi:hypothetical protein